MFYSREINKTILRKYVIHKSGNGEITSRLTIPAAEDHDGGQYLCVAENKVTRILVILQIAQIYLRKCSTIFVKLLKYICANCSSIFVQIAEVHLCKLLNNIF